MKFKVSRWIGSYCFISNEESCYLWKDGSINSQTTGFAAVGGLEDAPGYWDSRAEAETFLRSYEMNQRLLQVEKDIKLLEKERDQIEEDLEPKYHTGQWFKRNSYTGSLWLLAQVDFEKCSLILGSVLTKANRANNPIKVKDIDSITQAELDGMGGGTLVNVSVREI